MDTTKFKGQKAISYARASMGKGRGQDDSTDRQKDRAIEYCERMGMEILLDYSIVDEGVSAFKPVTYIDELGQTRQRAKNLQEGALADFVEIVRSGAFPDGINLVIEKLDRMYRDTPRRALTHFLNLLEMGVTIHSLMDGHIFEPNDGNEQLDLLTSVVALCASHYYSKDSGQRIKTSYDRRIEKMQEMENYFQPTGRTVEWIEKTIDKKTNQTIPFVSDKNREIIKNIFSDYLDGKSSREIANHLNINQIPTFVGKTWDASKVMKILKSRGVLGYYQPRKGIEIHYPSIQIISDTIFKEIQDVLESSTNQGRKTPDGNIFSNLLHCGYCESEYRRKKKKGSERIFLPTTMIYMPNHKQNMDHYPMKIKPAPRAYSCKAGRLNLADCFGSRVDYHTFKDAFFAFLKELDFGKLLDNSNDIDKKVLQSRIAKLRAEFSEIERKIENLEILSEGTSNKNQKLKYAKDISDHADTKDYILQQIEDENILIQKQQKEKKDLVANQDEIKKLIDSASTDHEYDALISAFVPLVLKKFKKDKALKEGFIVEANRHEFDESEKSKYKDFCRIWDLHRIILDQLKKVKDRPYDKEVVSKLENLQKEEVRLRKKYFSDEMQKDLDGFHLKKKLNIELKKIIKNITFYPYGFTSHARTKPQGVRKQKCSCMDMHREHLRSFRGKLDAFDTSKVKPSSKNGKWTAKELMPILGIGSRTTWKRYSKEKGFPDIKSKKFKLEDAIAWVEKKKGKSNSNSLLRNENAFFSQFMGFSIEFTDICKKDMVKYVLPYHKDCTKGIAFNLNTKNAKWDFEGSFGGKDIKLFRMKNPPKHIKEKQDEENIFYVEDDPIYHMALYLMMGTSTQNQIGVIEEINKRFSKKEYLKLDSDKEKIQMFQDALSQTISDIESIQNQFKLGNLVIKTPVETDINDWQSKILDIQKFAKDMVKKKKEGFTEIQLADEFFEQM